MPTNNGQPITRSDASELFVRYYDLKERNHDRISEVLLSDEEARRYHCGTQSSHPKQMDVLFLFDKASVQRIMDKMDAGEADGIMVFPGAHADGRPCQMLFPVKYDTSGSHTKYLILDEGEQHPANGGNGDSEIFTGSPELPSTLNDTQLY